MSKEHYVCKGECHGFSEKPDVCQSESCSLHGKDFEKCDCDGEEHKVKEN